MTEKKTASEKKAETPRGGRRYLFAGIAALGVLLAACAAALVYHAVGPDSSRILPFASGGAGRRSAEQQESSAASGQPPVSGDGWYGTPRPTPGNYLRQTKEYGKWREEFVAALARMDSRKQKAQADALRKWFHPYEAALQRWTLEGGRRPAVSPLFKTRGLRRLVSPPPDSAFEKFYGYKIVLPLDHHVFYYDGGPIEASNYLLHPGGVRYGGRPARLRDGVHKLFAEAGVRDDVARNVLLKVSGREGGFEAVNTWDTGYVSVGFIQFTTGPESRGRSLVRVLERMRDNEERKSARNSAHRNDYEYYFVLRGVWVRDGQLVVRDPASARVLAGADAVNAVIEDKRLIAVFQNAGENSRAFAVAQIEEAYHSYYLSGKFWSLPVACVETYVDETQPPRKTYVYGARGVELALAQASRRGDLPGRGESAGRTVVTRLPDIVARYKDALPSEGGMVALTDRAVQRGVMNACQAFESALIEVAGDGPLVLKDFRAREKELIARIQNRIDVVGQPAAAGPEPAKADPPAPAAAAAPEDAAAPAPEPAVEQSPDAAAGP